MKKEDMDKGKGIEWRLGEHMRNICNVTVCIKRTLKCTNPISPDLLQGGIKHGGGSRLICLFCH